MLRNLSAYYYKDPVLLYLVKVSQGLVHMGKGLMTVSPYHTERQLLSGEPRGPGGAAGLEALTDGGAGPGSLTDGGGPDRWWGGLGAAWMGPLLA